MIEVTLVAEDGSRRMWKGPGPAMIGRGDECAVRIRGWRVARQHARLTVSSSGVDIEDLGTLAGTQVNARRITRHGPLLPDDEIFIGGAMLYVRQASGDEPPPAAAAQAQPVEVPVVVEALAPVDEPVPRPPAAKPPPPRPDAADVATMSEEVRWRIRLHGQLLDALDLRRRDVSSMSDAALREEADGVLAQLIEADKELPAHLDRQRLRQLVLDEAVGLGPLERLLADESVTEIMVNRYDEIFIERAGRLSRHPSGFSSERAVLGVIERIVAPLGRRIDESSPMVDARLRDGSRVNAIIAPVALRGAAVTIRKFSRRRPGIDDLIAVGALDDAMANFLQCCVEQRCNVLVSGGTGSGKTTLLNVLSHFIPHGERIITIEDAAELRLDHPHLISLESRPSNLEGRGAILIRDLVRNALRMRPDRIVVGECRGAEALDMLQAMNTGHEGSLTTLHANTPRDAIARLETLVLMAGMDLPLAAIREQIASAIDIVVQQTRAPDGRRRITAIVEVTGMESGRIQMQEVFRYDPTVQPDAPEGSFAGCDLVPASMAEWRARGVVLDTEPFFGRTPARMVRAWS